MSDDGFAGLVLGVILTCLCFVLLGAYHDWSRPWRLAQLHCRTLGHSDGWWDGKDNRIRCVDIRIQERP